MMLVYTMMEQHQMSGVCPLMLMEIVLNEVIMTMKMNAPNMIPWQIHLIRFPVVKRFPL
jgi:hypothetical protein